MNLLYFFLMGMSNILKIILKGEFIHGKTIFEFKIEDLIDKNKVKDLEGKHFNKSLKILLFTLEKAVAKVLYDFQYFCNSLYYYFSKF